MIIKAQEARWSFPIKSKLATPTAAAQDKPPAKPKPMKAKKR
jgi:hypothetical protein